MVKHRLLKPAVVGSNPTAPAHDVGLIQQAIIEQLRRTAESNKCAMRNVRYDGGWYYYRGVIDTWYLAEAVAKVLDRRKHDRER